MWIAIDKDDNSIWIYDNKPVKGERKFFNYGGSYHAINYKILQIFGITGLTFENSPIEIEVKVKQ